MKKIICLGLLFFSIKTSVMAQSAKQKWVDSVYNKLSQKERIGQLFMVAAYSGGEKYNESLIQNLVDQRLIGGVIFMQGTAEAQAAQTNQFQQTSKVPLLIGMDAEWGLGMRLTGVKNFPRQMMLGATRNPETMKQMAMAIAYQCKRLGVNIDFAPDVDINNNPANPVINFRSFGDDKELVTDMARAYMNGLQDNGVMACLKHFPGHGDVSTDSHLDLPVIKKTKAQLQALELYPFQKLINEGAQSVMIAHLSIPALDNRKNMPSTLSHYIISDLLQKQMGFKGLIFTDALNMKGVAKYYEVGEVDLKAFLAGNDVLLFSQDVPKAIAKIEAAVKKGDITQARLATSVKKILGAKFDADLQNFKAIEVVNATADLNQYTDIIFDKVAREAVTLERDDNNILDKLNLRPNGRYSYINVGKTERGIQQNTDDIISKLKGKLSNLSVQNFGKNEAASRIQALTQSLGQYDAVIVGVHDLNLYPKDNYGLDQMQLALLTQLSNSDKTIFVDFGNAYAMQYFCKAKSSIIAYEENESTYKAVADVLLSRLIPQGQLPVHPCGQGTKSLGSTISDNKQNGVVVTTTSFPTRSIEKVSGPADNNVRPVVTNANPSNSTESLIKDPTQLASLDRFINSALSKGAFPGCQVLAMKDGQVVYKKNFGAYSYGSNQAVTDNTMFDIASVTKVAATTLAVMKLYEIGKISLDATLGAYLPFVRGTDKANLRISDVLMHQAGLKAWIPFYKSTLDSLGKPESKIYSSNKSALFDIPVASGMYMNKHYEDTIWKQILESPLGAKRYVYSDLDFLFLQKVVEAVAKEPLDEFVERNFYKPMGLHDMMFRPWEKKLQTRCAPSERDNYFRYQLIQGYVHDMGAAMLGGIAGHAGLFSNAEDLALMMQMLLNGGSYRGRSYLKPETIKLFSSYHSSASRRGYGFDKPNRELGDGGPASDLCTKSAFGHQGFTGTCAWADPETGIVFVFLSNRTNPSAENSLINKLSIRTIAQSYIYKALGYTK